MDAFTALLAYGVIALGVATFVMCARGLHYQRIGLDKRRRTAPRIVGGLAALYVVTLYGVFLTGAFGVTLPAPFARPAVLAILGALFIFSLSD